MKEKDMDWYLEKIEDIRKRKRNLHHILEPNVRKKIRDDLKREQRCAKRTEKNSLKKWIEIEIETNENNIV